MNKVDKFNCHKLNSHIQHQIRIQLHFERECQHLSRTSFRCRITFNLIAVTLLIVCRRNLPRSCFSLIAWTHGYDEKPKHTHTTHSICQQKLLSWWKDEERHTIATRQTSLWRLNQQFNKINMQWICSMCIYTIWLYYIQSTTDLVLICLFCIYTRSEFNYMILKSINLFNLKCSHKQYFQHSSFYDMYTNKWMLCDSHITYSI